jgi:hypothetical protein
MSEKLRKLFYSDLVTIWKRKYLVMENLKLGVARSGGSLRSTPATHRLKEFAAVSRNQSFLRLRFLSGAAEFFSEPLQFHHFANPFFRRELEVLAKQRTVNILLVGFDNRVGSGGGNLDMGSLQTSASISTRATSKPAFRTSAVAERIASSNDDARRSKMTHVIPFL